MVKFIKVNEMIVNIESIKKVRFISDDIYLNLFPKDNKNRITVDFVPFKFGEIELIDGELIEMILHLYAPEEGQKGEEWTYINQTYIDMAWYKLEESLGNINNIDSYEYKLAYERN